MEKLPSDFEIAIRIYNYNRAGESVWLKKLVDDLDKKISRVTISKNLDQMFDLGIISGEWEKIDGKWVRTFKISGEATSLISAIADRHPIQS